MLHRAACHDGCHVSAGRFEWEPTHHEGVDVATGMTSSVFKMASGKWSWSVSRKGVCVGCGQATSASAAKGAAIKALVSRKKADQDRVLANATGKS